MSKADAGLSLKGSMKPRKIPANPSRWERLLMKLRRLFG